MNTRLLTAVSLALLTTLTSACKDDDHEHGNGSEGGHHSSFPACQEIITACHPVDQGEGRPSECHGTAHDATSEADCTPIKDDCLATCAAAAAALDAGTD